VLGCSGSAGQSNLARVHRLGPKGKGAGIGAAILNMAMWYNRGGGKEYEVTVRRSERRVN
jgi:hypothetical protein